MNTFRFTLNDLICALGEQYYIEELDELQQA